jgi:lysophospholipase L1-like esterase
MLGDSLTDWGEWHELLGRPAANRGIAGDTTHDVAARLEDALDPPPRTLVLLIGVNDLLRGATAESTSRNILALVAEIRRRSPTTRVIVQSLLPVGARPPSGDLRERIDTVNTHLAAEASRAGYEYLDVASALRTPDGWLDPRFSTDGLHLSGAGYQTWATALAPIL